MAKILAKELEPFHPMFIEEPVLPENNEALREIANHVAIPIATGERIFSRWDFKTLLTDGYVDIIQPDMSRCGGLTEAKKIATLAIDNNILCIPHAFKTGILVAASMHLIAAIPNAPVLEYSVTESPIRKGILTTPFEMKDGYVSIPQKPGLGIEINGEVLDRYGV